MAETESTEKKRKKDVFFNLKFIAYCWSQMPPGSLDLKNFAKHCQFQLCHINKVLMKDPVWDKYTNEEIIAEYFAHRMQTEDNFLKEFEIYMAADGGEIMDFDSWADVQMKKDDDERAAKLRELEDKVDFSPDDVMGGS